MDIAYVAYTESHTLLLDANGICLKVSRPDMAVLRGRSDGEARCVGAQYVASIDPSVAGGLAKFPRPGIPMLFAAVDPDGRIYCVRTAPLVHFESCDGGASGVHPREYGETSSPVHGATQRSPVPKPASKPEPSIEVDFESIEGKSDADFDGETVPYRRHSGIAPAPSTWAPDTERMQSLPWQDEVDPCPPTPRYSFTPPHGVMRPPPPPPMRRPSRTPLPPPPRGMRVVPVPPPAPSSEIATVPRIRTPAPSSHAWLRDSPAAVTARRSRR